MDITLPSRDEIEQRIRACREEMAALKRMQRLMKAAEDAAAAKSFRASKRESEAVHA
jgi:uncharacterized small protein (DUF1192 family)